MTTTETFDAFEQRLVAAMTAEAETVAEPADGLDRIRGRVAHRRRARRATWLAAAAALVLVAGTVGILLRSSSTDSAPYVDTDSTGGMPLLGFDNETWVVQGFTPGGGYAVAPDQTGSSPGGVILNVVRTDSGYPSPGLQLAVSGEDVIDGQAVQTATATSVDAGGVETYRSPALVWEPAAGYRAMLVGNSSLPPEALAGLRSVFSTVISVDQLTWESRLRSEAAIEEPVSERPMLVLALPQGSTQVVSVSGDAVLAHLSPTDRAEAAQLVRLTNGLVVDQTTTTPIEVRNVTGRFLEGSAERESQLSWSEDGETYLLSVPWGTSAQTAADIADKLVRPSLDTWEALLFPADPIDMDLLIGGFG